jgi:hypothetical protein
MPVKSFRVYSRVNLIYLFSHQYEILGFKTPPIRDTGIQDPTNTRSWASRPHKYEILGFKTWYIEDA